MAFARGALRRNSLTFSAAGARLQKHDRTPAWPGVRRRGKKAVEDAAFLFFVPPLLRLQSWLQFFGLLDLSKKPWLQSPRASRHLSVALVTHPALWGAESLVHEEGISPPRKFQEGINALMNYQSAVAASATNDSMPQPAGQNHHASVKDGKNGIQYH